MTPLKANLDTLSCYWPETLNFCQWFLSNFWQVKELNKIQLTSPMCIYGKNSWDNTHQTYGTLQKGLIVKPSIIRFDNTILHNWLKRILSSCCTFYVNLQQETPVNLGHFWLICPFQNNKVASQLSVQFCTISAYWKSRQNKVPKIREIKARQFQLLRRDIKAL